MTNEIAFDAAKSAIIDIVAAGVEFNALMKILAEYFIEEHQIQVWITDDIQGKYFVKSEYGKAYFNHASEAIQYALKSMDELKQNGK